MSVKPTIKPTDNSPLDQTGTLKTTWISFFKDLEKKPTEIDNLDSDTTYTADDLRDKMIEMITVMKANKLA